MTIIWQLLCFCLWFFCLMIEDFTFVLIRHGETSQLICSAERLSRFYLVHGIERNFRTTCVFFIVILTGILCLYLIGSLLPVFFYSYLAILFLIRGVLIFYVTGGINLFNPYYPNFEFFHKNLRFGVFLSVDNYFTFKNSKKYVLMVPGPKY